MTPEQLDEAKRLQEAISRHPEYATYSKADGIGFQFAAFWRTFGPDLLTAYEAQQEENKAWKQRLTTAVDDALLRHRQFHDEAAKARDLRAQVTALEAERDKLNARWEKLKGKVLQRETYHRKMVESNHRAFIPAAADNCAQITVQHIYSDMADLEAQR